MGAGTIVAHECAMNNTVFNQALQVDVLVKSLNFFQILMLVQLIRYKQSLFGVHIQYKKLVGINQGKQCPKL